MSHGQKGNVAGKSSNCEFLKWYSFFAGLASGVFSAVLLQPADLLKTRLQHSGSSSLVSAFCEISGPSRSVLNFWRGTAPSVLRTGLGSAIYFTSLNNLRQNVAQSQFLHYLGFKSKLGSSHSSSLPELSNLANLVTGAVARASAGFVLMPMTVIKVRFESNLYNYKSIFGAGKDIFMTEGYKGFLSGIGATTARDAPYAGLYVLFYEQSKKRLSSLTLNNIATNNDPIIMGGPKSAFVNFSSGVIAAGLATALTNPFDAIKTRIQLQPALYLNVLHACRKMIREDGMKSLFDGLGLRVARKALSSALAWTLYEEVIRRVELRFS
ncbi:Mitochondrial glycine transporter [Golovinomyces cichoracearum]|uniref:Mitochondrial glycine transporter n=1 Tax=Golovinomyces cichoracearum TaxID=62708 RepID=A0A420I866_9PEZI|nr:Mitochondrial glycine transporter [Golovinomyces cichoracearum]